MAQSSLQTETWFLVKELLGYSHAHLSTSCLWLLSHNGRAESLQQRQSKLQNLKYLPIWPFTKKFCLPPLQIHKEHYQIIIYTSLWTTLKYSLCILSNPRDNMCNYNIYSVWGPGINPYVNLWSLSIISCFYVFFFVQIIFFSFSLMSFLKSKLTVSTICHIKQKVKHFKYKRTWFNGTTVSVTQEKVYFMVIFTVCYCFIWKNKSIGCSFTWNLLVETVVLK